MSVLTDILHELASVTGRNNLHQEIDSLDPEPEPVQAPVKTDDTLTEGGN